jgi:DNA-binding HxlR family transcriptional regulator
MFHNATTFNGRAEVLRGSTVKRKSFGEMPCTIAQALEIIGEWWSLLVIREAFYGTRRFGDFEARLGIARNILTARLSKLTERGILRRVPSQDGSKYLEYELTDMGQALGPVLISLAQWGSKWIRNEEITAEQITEKVRQERLVRAGIQTAKLIEKRKQATTS